MISAVNKSLVKTLLSTSFALIAFASNSVLCRAALAEHTIDPFSFTVIRLFSGAVVLFGILNFSGRSNRNSMFKGSWISSIMLFLYAAAFSFAYIHLETGTGALILFGAVQLTIILISLASGDHFHVMEWAGVVIAFGGFVHLVLPTVTEPSFISFILMAVAGIAWGIYTIIGRTSNDPLSDTAKNFIRTLPFIFVLTFFTMQDAHLSSKGIMLAVISGAIASGMGYTLWYIALGNLTLLQAGVLQLLVPVIAAVGGVVFSSESITIRLIVAAMLVLGGIALVLFGKKYFVTSTS